MIVIKTIKDMKEYSLGKSIGFVPTMGYLHDGHLSLIRQAKKQCDTVVVSIYVNPTQFGPNEDLDSYPRDFKKDKELCNKEGVDAIFFPDDKEMYPNGLKYDVILKNNSITKVLCGASRPGHFDGVTTIVYKLFDIIKPKKAFFGQKDYQQSLVIKQMVKEQDQDVEIIVCPILREDDGIAMSSRNKYLTVEERKQAVVLYQSLMIVKKEVEKGIDKQIVLKKKIIDMILLKDKAQLDYVEILDKDTLQNIEIIKKNKVLIALAVTFGKARLIDNILL